LIRFDIRMKFFFFIFHVFFCFIENKNI
jgi:hypothetical protein